MIDQYINRVHHADCLEFMKGMPDGCVDMIFADPPYGCGNMDGDLQDARVRDNVRGARKRDSEPIINDFGEGWERVITGMLSEAARTLNRDCCCCCCCGGGGPSPVFAKVANWIDERMSFFHAVVWDKSGRGNGMGWRYRRNYEFVMVSHRRGGKLLWADDSIAIPNVLKIAPPQNRQHPNEKPISLVTQFIEAHTLPGQIILDPFCGSGTTLVAAKMLGRRYIGIEIEERYVKIAEECLRNTTPPLPFTAQKAEQGALGI